MERIEKYIKELMEKSTPDRPMWNIEVISSGKKATWDYIDGCMIKAFLEMYAITGDKKYLDFSDSYIGAKVNEDGTIEGYDVEELNIDNINEPNVFAVPAVVAAFDRSEDWLDEMREYVFENRAIAEKYIKEHIPQIKAVEGDATYLMWVDIREVLADSKRFTAFLRANTGLFITPRLCLRQKCGTFCENQPCMSENDTS